MPKPKKTVVCAGEEAATEEEAAAQLSALLKKAHKARTSALLKTDCISVHVKREADRAGLDENMILAVYTGVVAHVLNPCKYTFRTVSPTQRLRSRPSRPYIFPSHPKQKPPVCV